MSGFNVYDFGRAKDLDAGAAHGNRLPGVLDKLYRDLDSLLGAARSSTISERRRRFLTLRSEIHASWLRQGRREPLIHVYRCVRLTGFLQKLVPTNSGGHAFGLRAQFDGLHLKPEFEG